MSTYDIGEERPDPVSSAEPNVGTREPHHPTARRSTRDSRGAITGMLSRAQFELLLGSSIDPAEADADRMASEALKRSGMAGRIQASSAAHEHHHEPVDAPEPRIRRSASAGRSAPPVSDDDERRVQAATRVGRPMPVALQRSMEEGFGADLSGIKIHTGGDSDALNDRFSAKAFTVGSDIFFRGGLPDSNTAEGGHLIAHEIAHTLQQGAVVRREIGKSKKGAPAITKISRGDHTQQLAALVPDEAMEKKFASLTSKMQKALTSDFGVKGMSWRRSKEARAWRQSLKDAGRQQAVLDVHSAMVTKNINLETEKAFYELKAKQEVYGTTKGSIATVLAAGVNDILEKNWTDNEDDVLAEAADRAQDAAWLVFKDALQAGKSVDKVKKSAASAAKSAAASVIDRRYAESREMTIQIKRKVMDKSNMDAATAEPASVKRLDQQVVKQVKDDDLGSKALDTVIEADSVTSGIGIVGKMLDQVVGNAGDQIALSVEIRIPIPDSPAYVSFTLSGKAARGIDGAMTAGVPVFGDPRRLEVMIDLAFKVGADLIGFDINAGLNFFVRGGGDDTALCMKAFSYGAYRTIAAISGDAANWWAGADKAVKGSKTHFAESWAAMVEEQAFKGGGAYVDVGAGLSAAATAKFQAGGSGFEAGLGGGVGAFWRYDEDALKASLNDKYAKAMPTKDPITGKDLTPDELKALAKGRRSEVSGRGGASWGINASVKAEIAGQGVTFAGSISGPMGKAEFGIELSAAISYSGGPTSTAVEKWGAGCATAIATLVKDLIGMRKAKAGGVLGGAADVTQIVNSGLDNAITNGLAKAWTVPGSQASLDIGSSAAPDAVAGLGTSSTLQVALIIGWDGQAPIVRLEIRSGQKLEINAMMGSAGIKVSAEKTARLLAVGYDQGGWDAEAFGVRAKKRKGQRELVGHRT